MSRDSSRTYVHLHSSRFADLFEEFSTPPNSMSVFTFPNANIKPNPPATTLYGSTSTTSVNVASGTTNHIPPEDIFIPPQHRPLNPEDEDDVVPDQHAAFGITRALAAREARERAWRDFDVLTGLVSGVNLENVSARNSTRSNFAQVGSASSVNRTGTT